MEGNDREETEDREAEGVQSDLSSNELTGGSVTAEGRTLEELEKERRRGKIEYVQSVLEGILFRMGVDGKVAGDAVEGDIRLEIQGDHSGLLIGKHGRTLDALQYLLNKICQRRFGEGERISVDAENYRKRRVEALENLALRLGEKAKRKRRAIVAGVFNSRDRRIIHVTLRDDAFVETESKGEGFYKKLVIRPKVSAEDEGERRIS
jgi:spoIIIJ-associated protein